MNTKKFWFTSIIAWLVFLGIDFFFHASLLRSLWSEEIAVLKPVEELFVLIPIGYLSFFLLTVLIGYAFSRIFRTKPASRDSINFALVFGLLYALSNLLGLYSYVDIPIEYLILFNLVYFVEICGVVYIFHKAMFTDNFKRMAWRSILIFFTFIVLGIVIQNIV